MKPHPLACFLFLLGLPLIAQAAPPVAEAGDDITIADFNGDESVTVVLDASGSTDTDGDIVTYEWTWSGGSASGERSEGTFPATDTPVTVTLTVTDGDSNVDTDTLSVSAYKKGTALFTDLIDPDFSSNTTVYTYVSGSTVVIDGGGGSNVGVYRRQSGVWVETSLTGLNASASSHWIMDENRVISGSRRGANVYGSSFRINRWDGAGWVGVPMTFSVTPPGTADFAASVRYSFTPDVMVVSNYADDTNGTDAGLVFIYDLDGDDWILNEDLSPPGGTSTRRYWGTQIVVEGDLLAVASTRTSDSLPVIDLFREDGSGNWNHEATLASTIANSRFIGGEDSFDLSGGVIVNRLFDSVDFGFSLSVYEKISGTWTETELASPELGGYSSTTFAVNSDGRSFVEYRQNGDCILHYIVSGSDWNTGTPATERLFVGDLFLTTGLRVLDFSDDIVVIPDEPQSLVRVFDTATNVFPINIEPVADAGSDLSSTSYDGSPVQFFLNGLGSSDLNYDEVLSATWTWEGGSVTGMQAFASIPPEATSVELKIIDSQGGVSRDTINVDIKSPPVVDAGGDVVVVDADGDGQIRLHVSGSLVSSDFPIVSWIWRWPGGVFSGQSGTIDLSVVADNQSITLEVIDANGLSSETEFKFNLLDPNPEPEVIKATDSANLDAFGYAVDIAEGAALVGAPFKRTQGSVINGNAYLLGIVGDDWQQVSLSPETNQGGTVILDDDYLFIGSQVANSYVGSVNIYENQSGNWTLVDTLIPDAGSINTGGLRAFGNSMVRSGNYLLVGARESDQYNGPEISGAAFLYELIGGSWTLVEEFISPGPPDVDTSESTFGTAVAMQGDTIVITSRASTPAGNISGLVRVYEKDAVPGAPLWDEVAYFQSDVITNNSASAIDLYGERVVLYNDELLIGAAEGDDIIPASGSVYRYTRTAGTWAANGKINPSNWDGSATFPRQIRFGQAMSVMNDVLVVSATADTNDGKRGSIYTFEFDGSNWNETSYLPLLSTDDPDLSSTAQTFIEFGFSVAHDGRDLIVGAPESVNASAVEVGKAYIYRNYAALNPDANYEPVADAGADIIVSDTIERDTVDPFPITEPLGSEEVLLDAGASSDVEGGIVSWEWTWDGGSASGETVTARFPVGTTTVTLTVTDDAGIVNSDSLLVTIALPQTPATLLPGTNNTLTVNLPVPEARWRLSSEFRWHGVGESVPDVVLGETYQLEIIAYPGSAETIDTFVNIDSANTVADLSLILPVRPVETGALRFPETSQGFAWRLTGESQWRDVTDNGDVISDLIDFVLPIGDYRLEFKPVSGYATPPSRLVSVRENLVLGLDWGQYLRINNFDPAKTFDTASSPDLAGSPYQYIGMIRTPLGRGTGTVVAERVVLTAGHLFFDANGLQWADTQWFPRQQEGERQAPPVTPRGILYRTSYAKLIAPDSIDGTVANLPDDDQEVDFAVLYFAGESDWEGGSANFLESSAARNWLTGTENKHALGYPQRSQAYSDRGKLFEKFFDSPLSPLDANVPPKLYETGEVFGDGGASGSALFVQPQGASNSYPAAILLAGQGRAVYRVIDVDVGRMIKDGFDAASGNDDVLDNNSSLVTFGGLGGFTTLAVDIQTTEALSTARWSVTPDTGTGYSNLSPTQQVGFNESWGSFTVSFTAVSGFATPEPVTILNEQVTRSATNSLQVSYEPLSGYDLWKQDQGLANDQDDRDHDGNVSLIEYAIDGDPDSGTDPVPLRFAQNPSQSTYAEFEVYVSATADAIRYEVKAADSLADKIAGTNIDTLATFTKADGSSAYLTVTDIKTISSSTRRFAWLEVTHDRSLSSP